MYEKLGYGMYKMMPQLGALAYLISRTGAQTILDNTPICRNIDVRFSQCIRKLNSISYINNVFMPITRKPGVSRIYIIYVKFIHGIQCIYFT